ncbi:MAG: hypothetical protein IJZ79_01950 [Bacilli bacterium]|nr:hypothetical protein [Bacilli bacterium]
MRVTIKPVHIIENEDNHVTSDKMFRSRKIKDGDRYLFHEDGIFSEKIFGKFGKCYCGELTKPGYCTNCQCRVLNKRNIPNFYIKFNFDLPNQVINYESYDETLVSNILNSRGFLYEGEYVEFDLKADLSIYDESKVLFGKEALMSIGVTEEWYNNNVHRLISIPHTSYRQITFQGDTYFIGKLNTIYINMIRINNKYETYKTKNILNVFNELNLRYMVCRDLNDLYDELFMTLAKNKRNIIDSELKGQPETGMIRAVMTNNFSLDEDTLLIGYYFIPTLYPVLYNKYLDEEGWLDIDGLNEELEREGYLVLFNRQPTIGAKSIIAMKPVFSALDSEQFVIQANPIVYDGLAADVDGDSLNVIALYSKESCEEAKKLLASNNYIEGSNSSIRNGLLEEFEYVQTILED